MTRDVWDGTEWQSHCETLLSMKHETNIQFVPDRTNGDHGIEAFRLDEGTVYQCYSPAEAFTTKGQTAAQKRKITEDLRKLYDYEDELMAMFGSGYTIDRWVLLTPYIDDKELVKHARKKSDEVRLGINRPAWWTDSFRVVVYTDENYFPEELPRLYATAHNLTLHTPIPTSLTANQDGLQSLDERLEDKLVENPMLAIDHELRMEIKNSYLLEYVVGQVRASELEGRYTEVWQTMKTRSDAYLRAYRRSLANGPIAGDPSQRLADDLTQKFHEDTPSLPMHICEELAWHFVASWWIQCPLAYRDVA